MVSASEEFPWFPTMRFAMQVGSRWLCKGLAMRWLDSAKAALDRWRAMGELRSLAKRQSPLLRYEFESLVIDAKDALERGQSVVASEIWSRARVLSPNMAMTFEPALELLLRLQSDDEAEAFLVDAQKRYPRHAPLIESLAWLEFRRHDYAATLRRCAQLRRRTPMRVKSYWIAADTLLELDRDAEAEATLAAGIRAVDDNAGLRIHHAKIPERSQNWAEALKRWMSVWNDFHHPVSLSGAAKALKNLGRVDEADRLLSEGLYRTSVSHDLLIESAIFAEDRKDWEAAALRWETLRRRFPTIPHGYVHCLRPLSELGRKAEADEILREGIDRNPDDPALAIEYARLAHGRGDWPEAALRWAAVRGRFPTRQEGYDNGSEALVALGETEEAERIRSTRHAEQ
jgi:tetratricopeptide (TPR) repeat protein